MFELLPPKHNLAALAGDDIRQRERVVGDQHRVGAIR